MRGRVSLGGGWALSQRTAAGAYCLLGRGAALSQMRGRRRTLLAWRGRGAERAGRPQAHISCLAGAGG